MCRDLLFKWDLTEIYQVKIKYKKNVGLYIELLSFLIKKKEYNYVHS